MKKMLIVSLLAFVCAGCPGTPPTEEELQAAYAAALKDAEVALPHEISPLSAVNAYNPQLIWEGEPGSSRVLVVTWTSWEGYDNLVGKSVRLGDIAKANTQTTRDIWVTLAPDVKNFFALYCGPACPDKTLRAEQLLGLPPHNGKTRFVEFYVYPADLFRPSPDPEISDREAELDFPVSFYSSVSPDYAQWFNDLKASSYGANGYPWTRLGYTYDWGNPFQHGGLSEYVIRPQATVEVHAVHLTDAYLNATSAVKKEQP